MFRGCRLIWKTALLDYFFEWTLWENFGFWAETMAYLQSEQKPESIYLDFQSFWRVSLLAENLDAGFLKAIDWSPRFPWRGRLPNFCFIAFIQKINQKVVKKVAFHIPSHLSNIVTPFRYMRPNWNLMNFLPLCSPLFALFNGIL